MSATYTEYKNSAETAERNKDHSEAQRMWHKALEEARGFGKDDGRYCFCLESIAHLYFEQDHSDRAEGLYQEALDLRKAHDISTSAPLLIRIPHEIWP